MNKINKYILSVAMPACLTVSAHGAAVVFYDFEDSTNPFNDSAGTADAVWQSSVSTSANVPSNGGTQSFDSNYTDIDGANVDDGIIKTTFADGTAFNNSIASIGTGNFSIAFWMNAAISGGNQGLIDARQGDAAGAFYINLVGGYLSFYVNDGSGDLAARITDSSVADSTWHHYAVTVDRGVATTVYLDGVAQTLVNSDTEAINGYSTAYSLASNNVAGAQIGGNNNNRHFNGLLDNFGIYDTALTQAEVNSLAGVVPEPSSVSLLGLGVLTLILRRKK